MVKKVMKEQINFMFNVLLMAAKHKELIEVTKDKSSA